MTDFITRPASQKWAFFIFVLLASWSVEVGKLIVNWSSGLDHSMTWSGIPWSQKVTFVATVMIGMGQTFLQLKSSAWGNATKKDSENAEKNEPKL